MTKRLSRLSIASVLAIAISATHAFGQSLANRIASASDRSVQFSYPVRPGVCGDGRTYISTGSGNFYGSFSSNAADQCLAGPARVVADLADRNVIALRTYVGGPGPAVETGVANLGTVTSTEAADFLIGVAARADGRVGRDAIFAALLGENVDLTSRLLDIGRDQSRPLETRRAALSGLVRSDSRQLDRIGSALVQIATNESDVQGVRTAALSALSRLDHGAGIQPLVQLAGSNLTSWVGREAMNVLARSGDPRARQFLRSTAQRSDLPDEVQAVALRGLGREYVTGQDANLLRSIYPRLTGQRSRDAVLASIAALGGSENVQWLVGLVRDEKLTPDSRQRALQYLTRAGATTPSLLALYDPITDTQMRQMLIGVYSRLADKAATDKLVWIAKNEQNPALKRRAISALSRNSDPTIRQALQDIVER
ncbi:MAG TPA: HEAT repeat domain-containing protein [Gemmatimonadaceae bacterium]|nr:HEAT repeat domain-containing protein [Gemmatimonadaceae bacterium]